MKKIALLNNTKTQMHHGCELVIKQIEALLAVRNIKIHANSFEGEDWRENKKFMAALPECDGIIVNGEGTIHHNRAAGKKLLEIADVAWELNIPCFLINTTYQDNPLEFSELLCKFTSIFVREGESQRELENLGIKSSVVPDLTLSYEYDVKNKRCGLGVTDSAMTPISEALFCFMETNNATFLPVVRSRKNDGKLDLIETIRNIKFELTKVKLKLFGVRGYLSERNLHIKKTIDEYISAIDSCKMVVSGRFHSDCFCILTDTPFLAIEGNSHKVRSMLSDIGLNKARLVTLEQLLGMDMASDFSFSSKEKNALREYKLNARKQIFESFDLIARSI